MAEFSISGFPQGSQGVDPDAYAQTYANEHGITLEEAKAELRAKYGDPQQQGMSMQEGILQFSGQGANFDINPYQAVPQDPGKLEKFIEDGAKKTGCTPQEFAEMMGIEPKQTAKHLKSATQASGVSGATTGLTDIINPETEENTRLTENDKKAWIKQYRAEHNCSRKEAKEAFEAEYEYDVMTRKEAKKWIKNYMEQTGCSKKEAKAAFEEQNGYKVPLNGFQKAMRFASLTWIGAPFAAIDRAAGGKLGIQKYIYGIGNNDAIYQKKV